MNATRTLAEPTARSTAREIARNYSTWIHAPTTADTVIRAIELAQMTQLNFWDGLIVASAEQVEAAHILSEDLNAGQITVVFEIPLDGGDRLARRSTAVRVMAGSCREPVPASLNLRSRD